MPSPGEEEMVEKFGLGSCVGIYENVAVPSSIRAVGVILSFDLRGVCFEDFCDWFGLCRVGDGKLPGGNRA